ILGAWLNGNGFNTISGTSMASPHIAGAAALLLSVNNNWTPSQISSALEMTSTAELANDFDNSIATPHERGAGRPRLADAANAGLYLNETGANFANANPNIGGNPGNLNLSGLLNPDCMGSCGFTRTVTDMAGGKSWTTSASGFPAGVNVSVNPSSFTLGAGASRQLTITVDLGNAAVIGTWVYGDVILSATGVPDAKFTVAVFASGGDLPTEWNIATAANGGFRQFALSGLADMPQATYTSGGLVRPELDTEILAQDPSRDDPYDGGAGVMTKLLNVPGNALWLHTETLQSDANDVDLFVGRDTNGDGQPELAEELCSSTTPEDLELCDILNPEPGNYWVVAQNWESNGSNDPINLETAVITAATGSINATGPGIVRPGNAFDVQVAWNDVNAIDGELLLGAVGIGTHADRPGNIGVIPVYFHRNSIGSPQTLALFDGHDQSLALDGNSSHNLAFIDIPPGADELTISASAQSAGLNNGLGIELRRMDFASAFSSAPQALPSPGGVALASATGAGGNGPQLVVGGPTLQPGRWYVDLVNSSAESASVTLRADVSFSGQTVPVKGQLWISENRPGISQGIDYQTISTSHGLLWYTFANNHDPAWYLAAGTGPSGNIWNSELLRFTNDGANQQFEAVGRVSMTMLDTNDAIFSWNLFGASGSERMDIIAGEVNTCPTINDQATSVSGFWGKAQAGLGGASVLFLDSAHAEIHYLFDALGRPVWLQAAGGATDLTLTQFSGNCPTCANDPISSQDVGLLGHDYQSESAAQWDFDYQLEAPLSGDVDRVDNDVIKLSDVRVCE
ncbi:MAG: S8 family serine peptidase, partial [Xanthomonadales bacterium]|nr:S8 family serine peptidase [Xanthomonadales bacterium]